jgi:hypothetical protein
MTLEEIKAHAVEMANANQSLMDGTTDPVRRLLATHDVVLAVWQDRKTLDGVGMIALKGGQLLREAAANDQTVVARTTAIPCADAAQAIALLDGFDRATVKPVYRRRP